MLPCREVFEQCLALTTMLEFEAVASCGSLVQELGANHAELIQFEFHGGFGYWSGFLVNGCCEGDVPASSGDKPGEILQGSGHFGDNGKIDSGETGRGVEKG